MLGAVKDARLRLAPLRGGLRPSLTAPARLGDREGSGRKAFRPPTHRLRRGSNRRLGKGEAIDGTAPEEAPTGTEPTDNDPLWATAVPFPPELVRRLDALAAKVGVVDPNTPIIGPVTLGESEAH